MNLADVVMTALVVNSVIANKRVKRILFGDVVNTFGKDVNFEKWKSPYDALYYSVAIKPGWSLTVYEMEWDDPETSWNVHESERRQYTRSSRNNRCGGSFLTPRIVQTACHCIAHLYSNNSVAKFVWEEPMVIIAVIDHTTIGSYSHIRLPWGRGFYSPKHYYAHRKCALWRSNMTRVISYDYGLISLAKGRWGAAPADFEFPINAIATKVAPLYTSQDLNKYYLNILKSQSICLYIGHGYNKIGNSSGLLSIDRESLHRNRRPSLYDSLPRHTWRHISSYRFCHDFLESVESLNDRIFTGGHGPAPFEYDGPSKLIHRPRDKFPLEIFDADYTEKATFTCSMNAGKILAVPSIGDGGYPVTCNNVYFAVQGMGWTKWTYMDRMSIENPIAFTKWENSAEYRENLVEKITEWGSYSETEDRRRLWFAHSTHSGRNADSKQSCDFALLIVASLTATLSNILSLSFYYLPYQNRRTLEKNWMDQLF